MMNRSAQIAAAAASLVVIALVGFWLTHRSSSPPSPVSSSAQEHSAEPSAVLNSASTAKAPSKAPETPSAAESSAAPAAAVQNEAVLVTTISSDRPAQFTLDSSSAAIRVGNQTKKLRSSDGLFERVSIPLEGPTQLQVTIPSLVAGSEVQIDAPNGGAIKRTIGPMRFTPKSSAPVDLNLEFTPNLGRGAYTVTVRQAGAVMTFDFWAGESTPVGEPGPAWTPAPETEETVP